MNDKEKRDHARKILVKNGYSKEDIEKILKLSLDKPTAAVNDR